MELSLIHIYKITHGRTIRRYILGTQLRFRLRLEHRFLYFYADRRDNRSTNIGQIDVYKRQHEGLAIEKEFLFTIFTTIQGIKNTFIEENILPDNKFYLQIIHKILQCVSIPFSGEPLEGMQIMGLMETRMLDFKNLIILSANEGILPKGGHASSFIPYNLRLGFRLPTPEHMDALFAYYFYRLLQRSENIKLLYTDVTKGMSSGEMSRCLLYTSWPSMPDWNAVSWDLLTPIGT